MLWVLATESVRGTVSKLFTWSKTPRSGGSERKLGPLIPSSANIARGTEIRSGTEARSCDVNRIPAWICAVRGADVACVQMRGHVRAVGEEPRTGKSNDCMGARVGDRLHRSERSIFHVAKVGGREVARTERGIARRGGSSRQGGHVWVGRSGCRANARKRTVSV
jgi:hypothetical protein